MIDARSHAVTHDLARLRIDVVELVVLDEVAGSGLGADGGGGSSSVHHCALVVGGWVVVVVRYRS